MSDYPQESFQEQLLNFQIQQKNESENIETSNQSSDFPTQFEQFQPLNQINENQNQSNQKENNIIQNNDSNTNMDITPNNLNDSNNNKSKINIKNNNLEKNKTKLENKFSFWYRIDDIIQYQLQKQALDKKEYEVQVKKIAEFDTVEDFWSIFQHLRKPDSCRAGIEYFMFKDPIKPMWEDENNKNGGRISIKLRKEYTTIIWEEMIFVLIGGILPKEMKEEINGIVVTSRKEFNTLQIWFKTYDERIIEDLEKCIRDILVIPSEVNLEIRQFNKNNNKKDYNNKKSGGYYYNKGYNNYYREGEYEYKNKDKNDNKKKKQQSHKNK